MLRSRGLGAAGRTNGHVGVIPVTAASWRPQGLGRGASAAGAGSFITMLLFAEVIPSLLCAPQACSHS